MGTSGTVSFLSAAFTMAVFGFKAWELLFLLFFLHFQPVTIRHGFISFGFQPLF
ncbi:hypothetical protein [Pedobacter glucosidilyticus]|uniref:hypothetical protein n=1 Tax=Pedobacter glucosidilyticus TaxID=1122941 RepID=UPI0026F096BF|nr:hypothetical protein [Pedobacter glucosidilyticus]